MHDILRDRLMRKIESLPEEQVYQTLDYIEFLETKYGSDAAEETSGLRRFAESVEDKLRKKSMSPAKVREAFQLLSAADRVIKNVSAAGRKLMEELTGDEDSDESESPVLDEASVEGELAEADAPTSVDEPSVEHDSPADQETAADHEPAGERDPPADQDSPANDDPPFKDPTATN